VQKTIHDLGKLEKQTPTKGNMNNQFDELAKGLPRSVTRRQALKKFTATNPNPIASSPVARDADRGSRRRLACAASVWDRTKWSLAIR
jgi:hypothetical protein